MSALKTEKRKASTVPITLSIEDEDGMEGWPYEAIVPVVFSKSRRGIEAECSFGAYPILRGFLCEFGDAPFSKAALSELDRRLAPYLEGVGCVRGGGIYRYYRSFVLWDKKDLDFSSILPSSAILDRRLISRIRVNRTDFDMEELLAFGLPTAVTLIDGEVLSVCSVNPASEGQRLLEISVYTRPEARNRGFAKSNAALLSKTLLEQKKGVVYVTSCRNRASLKLAKSLGFKGESRFYAVDAYRKN